MWFFVNRKDKTLSLTQSSVVIKFTYPGGIFNYIGETVQI